MTNLPWLVDALERAWDVNGFLGRLRAGEFVLDDASGFLALLQGIEIDDEQLVPKRFLSLLWFLPSFLAWQAERVAAKGTNPVDYARFMTEVHSLLEERLGVP